MKINLNTAKKKLIYLFIVVTLASSVHARELAVNTNEPTSANSTQFQNSTLTCQIINVANKTFGYDIYADGRLVIHQPTVPALPGNEGFKTKAAAEKVAQLVIAKIQKGEMPPAVTIEEMKKTQSDKMMQALSFELQVSALYGELEVKKITN